jgi:eukaryotic-like serine/threonine-protein kinase
MHDGLQNEEPVLRSNTYTYAWDWSLDDRYLIYHTPGPNGKHGLWLLPLDGDRKPIEFLVDPQFRLQWGRFSPDRHWVAYTSNESGRSEVYVQSFPKLGPKKLVSRDGGVEPKWRLSKELYFLSGKQFMAVDVVHAEPGKPFEVGEPHLLFQAAFSSWVYPYDPSNDGQRFIINGTTGDSGPVPITVITNWTTLLKQE